MEGTVVVIFGSGAGKTIVGQLIGTVVFVEISAGATVVVLVVGTCAGSTGVEGLERTLMEGLEGMIVGVVAVNRLVPAQDFPYALILWHVSKIIYLL